MTLAAKLKTLAPKILVVDDALAPADVGSIQGHEKAKFAEVVGSNAAYEVELRKWLGITDEKKSTAAIVIESDDHLTALFKIYEADRKTLSWLDPLFANLAETVNVRIRDVQSLSKYLSDMGVEVVEHSSLEAAEAAFADCRIVFLDLYLRGASLEEMTKLYVKHKDLIASDYTAVKPSQRRMVVLMSSQLPNAEELEKFKSATGLNSTFFRGADKKSFTKDWLDAFFEARVAEYYKAIKLMAFLDGFAASIRTAADGVAKQVERIEAHDLEILNKLRLNLEGESLFTYLTWLFSESVAARIRTETVSSVEIGPDDHLPFDGQVRPNDVLFELFSEVAFQYFDNADIKHVQFGDVFVSKRKSDPGTFWLVISPACDLLRCDSQYNVLCVQGKRSNKSPSLWDLVKGHKIFGDNQHVMRDGKGSHDYFLLTWEPKIARTIFVADLLDSKQFTRYARMNELFGLEIRESALRTLGRIGVQVDPSRPEPKSAIVMFKGKGKDADYVYSVQDKQFVSAIVSPGKRANTDSKGLTIFSTQFREWMLRDVLSDLTGKLTKLPDGLAKVFTFFEDQANLTLEIKNGGVTQLNGALKIVIAADSSAAACSCDCEITLLPGDA